MEQVLLGLIWFMVIIGGIAVIALPILMLVAHKKKNEAQSTYDDERGEMV